MKLRKPIQAILLFLVLLILLWIGVTWVNQICDRQPQSTHEYLKEGCKGWHWLTNDAAGFFTAFLCAITVFLAYYSYGLLRTTIDLARDANAAAARQFDLAETTAQRQLRAYVSIMRAEAFSANVDGTHIIKKKDRKGLREGLLPVAAVEFINSGQTPAHDVTFNGVSLITEWPIDEKKLVLPPRTEGSVHSLGRDNKRGSYLIPITGQLTPLQLRGLQNGQLAFVAFGRFTYRDIFDQEWETHFRYFVGGIDHLGVTATRMRAHGGGNHAT